MVLNIWQAYITPNTDMSCEVGTFIIPTLQMKKLKHKEVIRLA